MASAKPSILFAILCLVLAHELLVFGGEQFQAGAQKIDCESRCDHRCSKSSRHKMCMRACNTCCRRCNCVPPGTSGNEDSCPCYADMTTHGGRHKCP